MKIGTKILGFAALVAFSVSTQAQITFSTNGTLTAWSGTPNYVSLANASLTGFSAQGNLVIPANHYGVLAETFTPSSSFTLGSIGLFINVANITSPYQINLYDLGPAGTVSVSSGAATYTPGTSLFSDNNVTLALTGGEAQGTFTLPSVDQLALLAGEQYAFEIWTPQVNGNAGIQLYRNATADPGGQMFSAASEANARATLVGNGQSGAAPKTAALALYAVAPVPEPASMGLLGLGALAGMFAFRRRNQ